MGLVHIDLFTTLDGVAQAPGGPDEDTDGGFAFGGWQAPFADDLVGDEILAGLADLDALLLGRRTYDIFASYWPHQNDGIDGGIATQFNAVPKYVASRGATNLEWSNSHLVGRDLAAEIDTIRTRHENVHVIGSLDFAQTLLRDGLFDRLTLWMYPIVLGFGKRVFTDAVLPQNLSLLAPAVSSPLGVVSLRYARAAGVPSTGDMSRRDG